MTAAEELLKHVGARAVKYVQVFHEIDWDITETIEGTLEQVLPCLNFDYDHVYGHSPDILDNHTVIGNKYENPELLKR